MKRLFSSSRLPCVLAVGVWLGFSESGLGALARLAGAASGGRFAVEQPSGRLVGPLAFARLSWKEPGLEVDGRTTCASTGRPAPCSRSGW